jgi:methylated-DNA-[protein]-cysteine S-methyltransferase
METAIFDTALGAFGIGWTAAGIARVQLPGLDHPQLLQRINRGGAQAGEPPPAIADAMALIAAYAEGEVVDFSAIALDFGDLPQFHRRAYELLLQIGWGETTTYGALARQLGNVSLSRAVGQAMGANPIPLLVPCLRVLASVGMPGGFSAPGGAESKLRMLALEGVQVGQGDPAQQSFAF